MTWLGLSMHFCSGGVGNKSGYSASDIFPKISKKSKKKTSKIEFRLNRNGTEKGMPRVTCKKIACEQNDSKLMRLVRRLISRISSHNFVVCSQVLVGFRKRHDTIFLSMDE